MPTAAVVGNRDQGTKFLFAGATLEVPFQYIHRRSLQGYEVRDVQILTSEVKTRGINLVFEINCEG